MSEMIPRPEVYFRKLTPSRDNLLHRMEAEAQKLEIPIVGPVVGELLFLLAHITRSKKILELGTATGYSAIYLANGCKDCSGGVISLEIDPDLIQKARGNIRSAGLQKQITVRQADAVADTGAWDNTFDLIFIDIEKKDYLKVLPLLGQRLRKGGLLVADNVAFQDADPFNRAIGQDPKWRVLNVYGFLPQHSPEHDGVCLALRI